MGLSWLMHGWDTTSVSPEDVEVKVRFVFWPCMPGIPVGHRKSRLLFLVEASPCLECFACFLKWFLSVSVHVYMVPIAFPRIGRVAVHASSPEARLWRLTFLLFCFWGVLRPATLSQLAVCRVVAATICGVVWKS